MKYTNRHNFIPMGLSADYAVQTCFCMLCHGDYLLQIS